MTCNPQFPIFEGPVTYDDVDYSQFTDEELLKLRADSKRALEVAKQVLATLDDWESRRHG